MKEVPGTNFEIRRKKERTEIKMRTQVIDIAIISTYILNIVEIL